MRVTPNLLAPQGFFGRSMEELKRYSWIALTAQATRSQTAPYVLASFDKPSAPEICKVMSDADVGGFSRANLDFVPPITTSSSSAPSTPQTSPPHIRFHGSISIQLPSNRPQVQRTGYAAFRTRDRGYTVFGKSLWNVDPYAFLALRIKSDGRKYFINVQTESIVPTDLHQHRLYAKRPGEWETVLVRWNDFVRTNHGVVVEPQHEMMTERVKSVGIGLIDRVPGPFDICVQRIWATNGLSEEEKAEDKGREGTGLKGKGGETIRWDIEKKD